MTLHRPGRLVKRKSSRFTKNFKPDGKPCMACFRDVPVSTMPGS